MQDRPLLIATQPDEEDLIAIWDRYHAIDPEDLEENLHHWHRLDLYLLIRSAMVNYDRQVFATMKSSEEAATTIANLEALKP